MRPSRPLGNDPRWTIQSIIAKSFDDMRQEVFTLQLIEMFKVIMETKKVDGWLFPYRYYQLSLNYLSLDN